MTFSDALHVVLKREGGYVNDPADPGGETNFGITHKVYQAWRASHGLPGRSVRAITPDEVASIYETQYWKPCGGPDLLSVAPSVALQVFDMAVNAGVGRAVKLLQRTLHVTEDGQFGSITLGAARSADPVILRDAYAAERERFYRALVAQKPGLSKFLKGWLKRVEIVRQAFA